MATRPLQVLLEAACRESIVVFQFQRRLHIQNILASLLRALGRLNHLLLPTNLLEENGRAGPFKTLLLFCKDGCGLPEHDSWGNERIESRASPLACRNVVILNHRVVVLLAITRPKAMSFESLR